MKSQFKLKGYQEAKVNSMFSDIQESLLMDTKKAITLKAPTGAGKTIMLIALIEEIYKSMGTTPFNIIWVSESPDLNEQSNLKMEKFSDVVHVWEDTEIIDKDNFESFEENKTYYLNYGKITKAAKLSEDAPDRNRASIWRQFEDLGKSDRRIVLIIDEAHKGTVSKKEKNVENKTVKKKDRDTIIKEIINSLSPNSIVGVSATPQDFTETVVDLGYVDHEEHRIYPKEVIDSGMVKSTVINKSEKDPQHIVSQALIQEAMKDYDNSFVLWNGLKSEGIDLEPIMLVQVDNNMQTSNNMGTLIQYLMDSEFIGKYNIYNSFGEHTDLEVTIEDENVVIPYIKPNEINDNNKLRVVLFKEALGEGWDCPRAEILLSIRKVDSETKIAQTVGRILRNPLYDRPELTDKYPQLKEVVLFTSKYNQEILEEIENEFGQKTIAVEVDGSKKEQQVNLKSDVKKYFEKLAFKGYKRTTLENEKLDSLIQRIGEKSTNLYKGIDNAYQAVLDKTKMQIEDKLDIQDIEETLNRSILRQEKTLNKNKKTSTEEKSEFVRYESDIDAEFEMVCKDQFLNDELKVFIDEDFDDLEMSDEIKEYLVKVEYDNGYRKEAIIKLIILSLIHKSNLKSFLTNTVNTMLSEVSAETGEEVENLKHKVEQHHSVYLPLEVSKYNEELIENIRSANVDNNKGQFFINTDMAGYYTEAEHKGIFDLDSSIEIDFVKHCVKNNVYKTLLRNDASNNGSKGLAIVYRSDKERDALFCPDFIAIDKEDCLDIIETKGLNDAEWKNKLKGLIDFVKDLRGQGIKVKFRFILMLRKGDYYEINDASILSFVDGLNEDSIRSLSLSQIKKINL